MKNFICSLLSTERGSLSSKRLCGDTGYAGTDNRDYCKENGIQTSFVKRGRSFSEEKKEKDLVRKGLARVRRFCASMNWSLKRVLPHRVITL